MKKSQLLRNVQTQIASNMHKSQYICILLHQYHKPSFFKCLWRSICGDHLRMNQLRNWIRDTLLIDTTGDAVSDCASLEMWVYRYNYDLWTSTYAQPQVTYAWNELRLVWLDAMISYWEAQGE